MTAPGHARRLPRDAVAGGRAAGWRPRVVAALVALALAPPPVHAAPAKADRKLLNKVSALAAEAQTRFETADYAAAIELWTQAYAALPAEPAYEKRRNGLAYLIAQACVEAYELDPQLVYLRKAERLFEQYLETIKDQDTTAKVQGTLGELREKIRAAEEKEAAAQEATRRERDEGDAAEQARRDEQARAAARRVAAERDARVGRRLTISGGALVGVGGLAFGLMTYGLARGRGLDRQGDEARGEGVMDLVFYRDLIADGVTANRIAIIGGALGGLLVVAGVALIGAGASRERRARRELAVSPSWTGGGAGLLIRF